MQIARAVPILTVADLRASVASYLAVFGCEILMDLGWIVTLGTTASGPQFSLMETDQTAPVNPTASIEVPDADQAHEAAGAVGLEILHPLSDEEWGVRRFFFRDSAGNVINVLTHST
jgi:predicted enzyme related to lactoylglutathione lyase